MERILLERDSAEYQQMIKDLLSKESLLANALSMQEGEFNSKVVIHFSGLAALTLLGGNAINDRRKLQPGTMAFLELLANKGNIVGELSDDLGIKIEIRFLFAYPYSNFYHDLVQCELTRIPGISMECIMNDQIFEESFTVPKPLKEDSLKESKTFTNLKASLNRLQKYIVSDFWHPKNASRKISIKFCPINILTCYLQINDSVFSDPYLFSKKQVDDGILALDSPITYFKKPVDLNSVEFKHYCGFLSHFKYLWDHPLTLYYKDATYFNPSVENSLSSIKPPRLISYRNKALRLATLKNNKGVNHAQMDLWKQYMKQELQNHCTNFYSSKPRLGLYDVIKPIKVFIVGSWIDDNVSIYMKDVAEYLIKHFADSNNYGLSVEPIIYEVGIGENFYETLYKQLDASDYGIVIQTPDIYFKGAAYNKPNIPFEKGYLMGKVGKKTTTNGKQDEITKDGVFVFRHKAVKVESDNQHIGHVVFTEENLKSQLWKLTKWLWDITALNSEYALKILRQEKNKNTFDESRKEIAKQIKDIEDWLSNNNFN